MKEIKLVFQLLTFLDSISQFGSFIGLHGLQYLHVLQELLIPVSLLSSSILHYVVEGLAIQ